jgi:DNA-binding response OmpR family regulator
MKVLIADDDIISQKIMKSICVRLGYKVVTTADGQEALDAFKRYPVRIIISDWMMPKLDGLALCQEVRKIPDKDYTFFFLITGRRKSIKDFSLAREAGADDFIYKPLDFHVFRNQMKVAERMLGLIKE